MAATSLFALIVGLLTVNVQPQATEFAASKNCSNIVANDVNDAILYIDNCTFPVYKINASCVAESCPGLASENICPTFINGSYNKKKEEKIFGIVEKCLQNKTICGFTIKPDKFPKALIVATQFFKGTSFDGVCWINKNTLVLQNINDTRISLVNGTLPTSAPLLVQEADQVIYNGTFNCNITSTVLSDLNFKNSIFFLTNIPIRIIVNINSTSIVELNGALIPTNVIFDHVAVYPEIGHFNFRSIYGFLDTKNVFTQMIENYVQKSDVPVAYGKFISAIVDAAFGTAQKNCSIE